MTDLSTRLPERLSRTEETGLDPGLLIPLLRLLADGDPVTVEQLATAAGRTPEQVRSGLAAVVRRPGSDRRPGPHPAAHPAPVHRVRRRALHLVRAGHPGLPGASRPPSARGVGLPGQRRDDPRRRRSGRRSHKHRARHCRGLADESGPDHLDPIVVLQPGALLHLCWRRCRVARRASRGRGGAGGRGASDRSRTRRAPARPVPG